MSKHKINKVISLLKVKVEITASGADGDKDVLPKFLLLREVCLRLEMAWSTMLTMKSNEGHPIILMLSPMQDVVIPLSVPWRHTRNLCNKGGAAPQQAGVSH